MLMYCPVEEWDKTPQYCKDLCDSVEVQLRQGTRHLARQWNARYHASNARLEV